MAKQFTTDFTEGRILVPLIKFGTPLFLANLLQIFYNMADMIIVGNVCGNAGISAVSVGGSVTEFFTVLIMGFSNAAQVIISQLLGARKKDRIGRFIGTFALTLLVFAAVNTTVALLLRRELLLVMNTPEEAFQGALSYSVVSMSGIVFVFGYNAVSAIMRGLGDSKRPFVFIAIAAVTNVILDLVFVSWIGWGTFGAALATVIAQALSFLVALIYLGKNKERLGFEIKKSDIRFDRELLGSLLKLGVPMALKSAAVSFSMLFTNSFIYSYGLAVTTITGIGSKINQIGNLVSTALNTAGSSMVGQNIGAEKYNRVPKIIGSVWMLNIIINSLLSGALIAFPKQIFALFASDMYVVDTAVNMTTMEVALQFLPIAVMALMASAFRSGANSLINGSGSFAVNFIVAILDAIILRVGLGLLLGLALNMGYMGFWLGCYLSAFTPFIVGIIYFISGRWKTRKHIVKD